MTKNRTALFVFGSLLFTQSAQVHADVYSTDWKDRDKITVKQESDGRVRFSLCKEGLECTQIGLGTYSKNELNRLSTSKYLHAAGVALVDGVGVAGAAAAGAYLGVLGAGAVVTYGGLANSGAFGAAFIGLGGGGIAGLASSLVGAAKIANPANHYRVAKVLNADVAQGDIAVNNSIEKLAKDLNGTLLSLVPSSAISTVTSKNLKDDTERASAPVRREVARAH